MVAISAENRPLSPARPGTTTNNRVLTASTVTDHVWLAKALANRYRRPDQDYDDLFQIACLGLTEAVHRFDPELGEFLPFASATIHGLLKRHFRDHVWSVRLTRSSQELLLQMRHVWPQLAQELGHVPSHEELAERLGVTVEEVALADRSSHAFHSTSIDGVNDHQSVLRDCDSNQTQLIEARHIVARLLTKLKPEERRLIYLRFYEERSQTDIAEVIGTNQMQVSRALARLMRRMRRLLEEG
ncbi:MAG TPA: sigma-70 family RNA polymerase sigma factor [Propionibacterium sp.]|nr:sigma-70 family RNA polymerase sigma factor [Propionibacterium sp.]